MGGETSSTLGLNGIRRSRIGILGESTPPHCRPQGRQHRETHTIAREAFFASAPPATVARATPTAEHRRWQRSATATACCQHPAVLAL